MWLTRRNQLLEKIQHVENQDFNDLAIEVFLFQYEYNAIYKQFIDFLKINPKKIQDWKNIPFLPIQFFKQYEIKTGEWEASSVFSSSGTTGQISSKHLVLDTDFYIKNTLNGFQEFYGAVENYCVLALLPAYLERTGSSLVVMADAFIKKSKYNTSGFFLDDYDKLAQQLLENQRSKTPTLLIGVTFALLDLAEKFDLDLSNIIVMETGGMKGRRKEITREELHEILYQKLNIQNVHSEYGMTELLSQGYSKGKGIFYPCGTLRILTKEINDPLANQAYNKNGVLHLVDLANLDSCAFIASEDLGVLYDNGSFEVKGRLDSSEMRGCNLMVE